MEQRYNEILTIAKESYGSYENPIALDLLKAEGVITQAHTDGFNLGLIHGRFLQGSTERNLLINEGQLHGMKHGWLDGFEAGQKQGVK